jgi:hypothetical protein
MELATTFGEKDVAGQAELVDETLGATERCGYGACSQCTCKGYMGSGDICGNCHHNYSFHW